MQLDHSFSIPVGIDEAWAVLTDLERVVPCMPGAALTGHDGDPALGAHTGTVKIKLGAISLTYKGVVSFTSADAATHVATIEARGRDAQGGGSAAARVTASLVADGPGTRVDVATELDITGRPAQFGRGVLVDVGNKLIGQFADRLAEQLRQTAEVGPAVEAVDGSSSDAVHDGGAGVGTDAGDDGAREAAEAGPSTVSGGSEAPAPVAPETTVPGVAAPTARPAPAPRPTSTIADDDDDAVDLLKLVGPALTSRLAKPLAAVAAVLLVVCLIRCIARRR
jgi:carbon monoxide dehydrogenase subunit G